jgi:hypothetical protein
VPVLAADMSLHHVCYTLIIFVRIVCVQDVDQGVVPCVCVSVCMCVCVSVCVCMYERAYVFKLY